eukprot:135020_1
MDRYGMDRYGMDRYGMDSVRKALEEDDLCEHCMLDEAETLQHLIALCPRFENQRTNMEQRMEVLYKKGVAMLKMEKTYDGKPHKLTMKPMEEIIIMDRESDLYIKNYVFPPLVFEPKIRANIMKLIVNYMARNFEHQMAEVWL